MFTGWGRGISGFLGEARMSDIKAGDLVMVVRSNGCPCPAHPISLGRVFRVSAIAEYRSLYCAACGKKTNANKAVVAHDGPNLGYWIGRLKKIDPPVIPESVTEREELTA